MVNPRWSTIGLFVVLVIQFALAWVQAKRDGRSFREAVLPSGLIAGAISIVFARGFFGELPVWIEAPLVSLCLLLILTALVLLVVQLKRYLKDAWSLERKTHK